MPADTTHGAGSGRRRAVRGGFRARGRHVVIVAAVTMLLSVSWRAGRAQSDEEPPIGRPFPTIEAAESAWVLFLGRQFGTRLLTAEFLERSDTMPVMPRSLDAVTALVPGGEVYRRSVAQCHPVCGQEVISSLLGGEALVLLAPRYIRDDSTVIVRSKVAHRLPSERATTSQAVSIKLVRRGATWVIAEMFRAIYN